LVTRSVTERPEALATGAIRLVGSNASEIIKNVEQLLDDPNEYGMMSSSSQNPYGDGKAAQRIAEIIARKF
jgi:UDP-N-acetylglucosamine 2-epimerase